MWALHCVLMLLRNGEQAIHRVRDVVEQELRKALPCMAIQPQALFLTLVGVSRLTLKIGEGHQHFGGVCPVHRRRFAED
jgi:hypothetical protein